MRIKLFIVIVIVLGHSAAMSLAATIPAGAVLTVSTVSLVTSQNAVGSTFEAKIAQDISAKGNVLVRAGTKAFGKVASSRYNPRKSEPLTMELTSISVNGHKVAIRTYPVQPGSSPVTARQAHYGHTAGTLVIHPGTKMQFQLAQPVTM